MEKTSTLTVKELARLEANDFLRDGYSDDIIKLVGKKVILEAMTNSIITEAYITYLKSRGGRLIKAMYVPDDEIRTYQSSLEYDGIPFMDREQFESSPLYASLVESYMKGVNLSTI